MNRAARTSRQMGPQESMDRDFAANNRIDRSQALENQNRSHAQRTSDIHGAIKMVGAKVTTAVMDIDDYNKFVTSRFEHVGNVTETKFNDTDARINSIESNEVIIEINLVVASRRLDAMDKTLTRMVETMRALHAAFTTPGTAPPQAFDMSTPVQHPQQPQ